MPWQLGAGDGDMSSVAYLISTFPVLEETFILGEILELERQGMEVQIFSLRLPPPTAHQREARLLMRRTHYAPYFWDRRIWLSLLEFLFERPGVLAAASWELLRDNRDDLRCLLRSAVMIPKALFFARTMRKNGVKHVHAHWATYPAAVAAFIARLLGLSYSVTAHAYDIYTRQQPRALARRLGRASFVATCSKANREYLHEILKGRLVAVHEVYHGVDTTRFRARGEPAASERVEVLAGCGTLDPRKGLRFLIDACAIVKERGLPFSCRIVGSGPELPSLEKQAEERGLAGIVNFLPPVPQDELVRHYQECDIFVQPSIVCANGDKDVIPNCLLEAMACGLGVIATRVSSIPEVIEDGRDGLLVPERDPQAIAAALTALMQDAPLRARLGENARRRVAGEFDRQATTRTLLALFQHISALAPKSRAAVGF